MNKSRLIICVRKYLLGFLTLFFVVAIKAQTHSPYPDFAFPSKVMVSGDSILKKAILTHNDVEILRSLMDLSIAQTLLDSFYSPTYTLELTDSVFPFLSKDFLPLADVVKADILQRLYSENREVYDARKIPSDSVYTSDPDEWNGEMFMNKILNLIKIATDSISSVEQLPIKKIAILLEDPERYDKLQMTVTDFVLLKSISILKTLTPGKAGLEIPFYSNLIPDNSLQGKIEHQLTDICDRLIGISKKNGNNLIEGIAITEKATLLGEKARTDYLYHNYLHMADKEGGAAILYSLWNNGDYEKVIDPSGLYSLIKDHINKFPEGYMTSQLEYAASLMALKRMEVTLPRTIFPGESTQGTVALDNIEKGYVLIFRLTPSQVTSYDDLILKKFSGTTPLYAIEVEKKGEIPFSNETAFNLPPLSEGIYVAIPSENKTLKKGWKNYYPSGPFSTFRVTSIAILSSGNTNEKNSGRVYVVNGRNQAPMEGATVWLYQGNTTKPTLVKNTGTDGSITVPDGYYRIEAKYGKSVARSEGGFNYYPRTVKDRKMASILTDLSIYRPGDTVRYAVIGWLQTERGNKPLTDSGITLTLRDVNFKEVGKDTLYLDASGRSSGWFKIPEDRLSGTFRIMAEFTDTPGQSAGGTEIEVNDYKLPEFIVNIEKQPADFHSDTIAFTGSAITYSGMDITEAPVEITVRYIPWFGVRRQYETASFTTSTTTGSDGTFSLKLPTAGLNGTTFEKGRFSVVARVTASDGVSEESRPLFFYLGEKVTISPSIKEKTIIDDDTVRFNIRAYDISGSPVIKKLAYKITDLSHPGDTIKGDFLSPILSLPSELLPSGRYAFEFMLAGEGASEEGNKVMTETVVYRTTDSKIPYPTSLWIPQTQYYFTDSDNKINVRFGSFWPGSEILCLVSDKNGIRSRNWVKADSCITSFEIEIPDNRESIFINLAGMHDFSGEGGRIDIIPDSSRAKMEVEAISFRENITANSKEHWQFRFTVNDSVTAGNIAAFAVMTDKALNAIKDFKWNLNIWNTSIYPATNLRLFYKGMASSSRRFSPINGNSNYQPIIPSWQTYGFPLIGNGGRISRGFLMYKMANAEAPMAAVTSRAAGNVMDMAEEAADEASSPIFEKKEQENFVSDSINDLRPNELPVAFFNTNLTADDEGILNLDFTVPDFNTTWQLQVAGYNEQMLNAVLQLDALSSKSVMVKSNLPQFLRSGDIAEIAATIYNNSEKDCELGGRIIISDPLSGDTIYSEAFEECMVSPSKGRVINVRFKVPESTGLLSVTTYGFSGNNRDGERGLVTILPSSVPVIDAKTFFLGADEREFSLSLPKYNKNDRITLKYCNNPLWDVFLSLPDINRSTNPGSLNIARQIYSLLTGKYLIDSHPVIAEGLNKILNSSDSTLTMSALQKEEYLKTAALNATPWINSAESQTASIRSLSLYLEPEKLESQISTAVSALKNLQNQDGGWSWFEGMKSSEFITSKILGLLGWLKSHDMLHPTLLSMAKNGIKYYDGKLTASYEKGSEPNKIQVLEYLYHRQPFGEKMNATMKTISNLCEEYALAEWRHWTLREKSIAAIVLWNNGKREDAATIVESLNEFTGRQRNISDLAMMLEAFALIAPDSQGMENILQLLFMKKETQDFSNDPENASLIHAMLSAVSPEVFHSPAPVIKIGNEVISLPDCDEITGNYTLTLLPEEISGKSLGISRSGGIVAWGGVICQQIQPVNKVKSSRVADLAINKAVYISDSRGKIKETTLLKKGDRVIVSLLIECKKDMEYLAIIDQRAACLQPTDWKSGIVFIDGMPAYREIRKDRTSFFIEKLPEGKHIISYECTADRDGEYALGIANIQSLYSPIETARTAGEIVKVVSQD